MAKTSVYLGKPGLMRELPIPNKGWSPKRTKYSALSRSLNGLGTETLFGTKRAYSLEFDGCTATDVTWFDQCLSGAVRPLHFIDPLTPNRFPEYIASTGSSVQGARKFQTTGGSALVASESVSDGPQFSVMLSGGTALTYNGVIVVPGETITVSSYLHATRTVTPYINFLDTTGAVVSTTAGTTVAAGSSFVQSTTTAAVPSSAATMSYSLTMTASGNITTTAWSATATGLTSWTAGGGAIRCTLTDMSLQTNVFPYATVSISLEEL